ncbi:MAG: hypothetical protein BMS9Abin26_1919 [Gammaproteobacteria bacterium]|nr:MAG: hypothetical protein BMS9Abin26_1919 [Gammaproteobacteria bacterium]
MKHRDVNLSTVLIWTLLALVFTQLSACTSNPSATQGTNETSSSLKYLAKTDIDTVSDQFVATNLAYLRTLTEKLYRRNPGHCTNTGRSIEQCISRLFDSKHQWDFEELDGRKNTDALMLAFDENYHGDRVMAFIIGLSSMIIASYNNKTEFFILDELDPQKLYNSARNIEIAVWKLSNNRDKSKHLFLLSNSGTGEVRNLSYERLFGKLIATQDLIAKIISQSTNRRIKNIIQSVATAVFIPI